MKVTQGMLELLIVIVMLVASVPLLATLLIVMNNSSISYLDDKTVFSAANIEYEKIELYSYDVSDEKTHTVYVYSPANIFSVGLDYGAAQILAVVQDDYGPDEAKKIEYAYTATSPYTSYSSSPTLTIKSDWKSLWKSYWKTLMQQTNSETYRSEYCSYTASNVGQHHLYLVWNTVDQCWMITSKQILLFGS